MKILKFALISCLLFFMNNPVSIGMPADSVRFSKDYAVNAFSKTLTDGSIEHLEEILDESFQFSMLRLNDQASLNKRYLINFYKKSKSFYLKQDCYVSSTTIMSSKSSSVVKLDLHYKTFMHSYFLSLANRSDGWKIIYVYSLLNEPNG